MSFTILILRKCVKATEQLRTAAANKKFMPRGTFSPPHDIEHKGRLRRHSLRRRAQPDRRRSSYVRRSHPTPMHANTGRNRSASRRAQCPKRGNVGSSSSTASLLPERNKEIDSRDRSAETTTARL